MPKSAKFGQQTVKLGLTRPRSRRDGPPVPSVAGDGAASCRTEAGGVETEANEWATDFLVSRTAPAAAVTPDATLGVTSNPATIQSGTIGDHVREERWPGSTERSRSPGPPSCAPPASCSRGGGSRVPYRGARRRGTCRRRADFGGTPAESPPGRLRAGSECFTVVAATNPSSGCHECSECPLTAPPVRGRGVFRALPQPQGPGGARAAS